MRTIKTCCCCGDRPCKDWNGEYRYDSTENTNCPICALGTTTTSIEEYEEFAPYEPEKNQGDSEWDGRDSEGDGHPDNLHYGNLCWHPGEEGWEYYSEGCSEEWNPCWEKYNKDNFFPLYTGEKFIPESTFYQFDSPMGILPWSPQAFKDWRDNWGGPLLPEGDCTMHCTLGNGGNIGCHKLAFVGALGKNFGSLDSYDTIPLCGADIVTVPPPRGEWAEVREWVRNGGKLIVMGESSGSPGGGDGCKEKIGFINETSTFYIKQCNDDVSQDGHGQMTGEEVANLLREFALYCAKQIDEEEIEEFFEFRDNEYYDPDREENFINNFEAIGQPNDYAPMISCCQRSRVPFIKSDGVDEPSKPFSFHCSSSSGLIPKGKGKGLVGHCNGEGCTVVWKGNGSGAVVVVYDANTWGASQSQIPISYWEIEASHPDINLTAEQLKLRACNNDFWKFMCDDFLGGEFPTTPCNSGDNYWDNINPENYKHDDNPCLPVAACCLPNGECKTDMTVWECFGYEDGNGRKLPGIWFGSSESHPSGVSQGACLNSCGPVSCTEQDKGVCCATLPESICAPERARRDTGFNCCLSEDEGEPGTSNLVYEYECCDMAYKAGLGDNWTWISEDELSDDLDEQCDECFIMGVCCEPGDSECHYYRKSTCDKIQNSEFHENTECADDESICNIGACCWGQGVCGEFTELFCNLNSGEYQGDNVICEPDTCSNTGACCDGEYCISDVSEDDCDGVGGVWQGSDSTCNPNTCVGIGIGTCCVSAEDFCKEMSATDCDSGGGEWFDCTDCCAEVCPQPEDWACCYEGSIPDCEICTELSLSDCSLMDGTWKEFQQCSDVNCDEDGCQPDPTGACCRHEFSGSECLCDDNGGDGVLESDCQSQGEVWHVDQNCNSNAIQCCGICCYPNGECRSDCIQVSEEVCDELFGNYSPQPPGIFCDETCSNGEFLACDSPMGACCVGGHCTENMTSSNCIDDLGGWWAGENVDCTDGLCELGACCDIDENCEDVPEDACNNNSWYRDIECADNPCGDVGACCLLSGNCHLLTPLTCEINSGSWMGGECVPYGGYICSGDPYGACCWTDGTNSCLDGIHVVCCGELYCTSEFCDHETDNGGNWRIIGGSDDVDYCCNICNPSGELGACCICGWCFDDHDEELCIDSSGTFYEGNTCIDFSCPATTGACCDGNLNCTDNKTMDECENDAYPYAWYWHGCDTTCDDYTCWGACCDEWDDCWENETPVGCGAFNDFAWFYTCADNPDGNCPCCGIKEPCQNVSCNEDADCPSWLNCIKCCNNLCSSSISCGCLTNSDCTVSPDTYCCNGVCGPNPCCPYCSDPDGESLFCQTNCTTGDCCCNSQCAPCPCSTTNPCDPNPCLDCEQCDDGGCYDDYIGVCCFDYECIAGMNHCDCDDDGNAIWVPDVNCNSNPCGVPPVDGACCVGTSCTVKTEADCSAIGGTYQGDNTECFPNPCTTTQDEWACCWHEFGSCDDSSCSDTTQQVCNDGGGEWREGQLCNAIDCDGLPVGACCFCQWDTCDEASQCDCDTFGGMFIGEDTLCNPNQCTDWCAPFSWGCAISFNSWGYVISECRFESWNCGCIFGADSVYDCHCCPECSNDWECKQLLGCCLECIPGGCTTTHPTTVEDCQQSCLDNNDCYQWNWQTTCLDWNCGHVDGFVNCDACSGSPQGGPRTINSINPEIIGVSRPDSKKEIRNINSNSVSSNKFDCSRECIVAGCECDCIKTLNGIVCLE